MVDVKAYRERGVRTVTTAKSGETFTVHRVSPLRLVEIFSDLGVGMSVGERPDVTSRQAVQIASTLLPECVDEVVARGEGDDEHLEVDELDLDDAMELFSEAIELSGVREEEIAKAERFRVPPDGADGRPGE